MPSAADLEIYVQPYALSIMRAQMCMHEREGIDERFVCVLHISVCLQVSTGIELRADIPAGHSGGPWRGCTLRPISTLCVCVCV
jgi:hypothetical protein